MAKNFNQSARQTWFPGHMLKAEKAMAEALDLVDLVVVLLDARAPLSTRNPRLEQLLLSRRPHALVANKSDLASGVQNRRWKAWFEAQGDPIDFLEASHLKKPEALTTHWKEQVLKLRQERGATRPLMRPVRLMIVGIPNIGKSTLVNHLRMRNIAKVEARPGVTRQNQWVPLAGGVELLDTPGLLWPQLKDKNHELLLTALGNIPDESTDPTLTAEFLITCFQELGLADALKALDLPEIPTEPAEVLEQLALRRKMFLPGGRPALANAAQGFLKDYRAGRLGRYTLEVPPAEESAGEAEEAQA